MTYVVYEISTSRIATEVGKKYYATERAAKAAITRAVNKGIIDAASGYAIADNETYRENIEQTKIVKNFMNGKEVEISVNTPRSCDPSTELFWSM